MQDAIPLILHFRTMCQFRTISSSTFIILDVQSVLHSITNSGLIAGGQNSSRERQTVFFTAVNPMHKNHKDPKELDLTKPRHASYKQEWKRHQDTVYWVDVQLVPRKGLKFYHTRCNAIILYDTLSAYCISIVMKSEEIIYQKVYVSPRPPPKISLQENGDERIGFRSRWKQQRFPTNPTKTKTKLSRTGRPVGGQESTKEIEKGILFDHEDIKHSTRKGRPVGGFKSTQSCVSMPRKKEEEDQKRTVRPVGGQESTKGKEHDIDFGVPGLSHAVVKHLRVQELVKKFENHPHREALHADLQQNNVYNPFSKNSKAMIRLYWNQGIVYCTCGQCLIDSESRSKFSKRRVGALSFPHCVIKKGRSHGARHGKTEEQKEYHIAWNARKRANSCRVPGRN